MRGAAGARAVVPLLVWWAIAVSAEIPEEDLWYVVELAGERAGYAHVETTPTEYDGRPAVRRRDESRIEIRRAAAGREETLVMTSSGDWIEALDGSAVRFTHRADLGAGETVTFGEVEGGRLRLHILPPTGGERRRELPWPRGALGPAAEAERVARLLAGAAEEVEEVHYKTFSVDAGHRVLDVTVRRLERRQDGGVLLEHHIEGLEVPMRELWDSEGRMLYQEAGPMVMRLADREEALARVDSTTRGFESLSAALDRPLPDPRGSRRAAFGLRPRPGAGGEGLAPGEIFLEDRRQRVERRREGEVLVVEVPSLEPAEAEGGAEAEAPPASPELLRPSALIESGAPEIRRLAAEIVAGVEDPLERARLLEAWVRDHVHYRGSGIGLATARQTLASRDGDCTEAAVLLTALLRAAGIPARLVAGLVYSGPPDDAFLPHAWVEAHLPRYGGWVAFDAAVYGPRVDATHLAMAKSAGREEGALLELAAPLLRGLGRFDLEWVEP